MSGVAPSRGNPRWLRPAQLGLIVYFALRVGFLALALSPSLPPDETTHAGRVSVYARALPKLPADDPATYPLGPFAGQPFLYPVALAVLSRLAPVPVPDLLLLRLVNGLLGLATVLYGLGFIGLVTRNPGTRTLFLVLLTNTLMFTGICAAVSYDNLANLLATAGLFHLFRFFHGHRGQDLLWLAIATLAGCLTKITLAPLAGIYAAVLLARERRSLARLLACVRAGERLGWTLAAVAGALLAANLVLYGGNWLRYGRLQPTLEGIAGSAAAMAHRTSARNIILRSYRRGEVDFGRALAMADGIGHAADRLSTRSLLRQTRQVGRERIGPIAYTWIWARLMLQRTFGYFGHRVLRRTPLELAVYAGFLLGALALFLGSWRPRSPLGDAGWAGLIASSYLVVLMLGVNWPTYLQTGLVDFAVQGRYAFPVLAAGYAFVACGLVERAPGPLRAPLAWACALFFAYGDLPSLLLRAGPAWFGGVAG